MASVYHTVHVRIAIGTFLYNTSKNTFPHFIPPLLRGVRRGLVSRWAVKPACLVYIPIRGEGVYLKRFLILFFKLPLALRAAAMRAAASLPALVRWSRWPS